MKINGKDAESLGKYPVTLKYSGNERWRTIYRVDGKSYIKYGGEFWEVTRSWACGYTSVDLF